MLLDKCSKRSRLGAYVRRERRIQVSNDCGETSQRAVQAAQVAKEAGGGGLDDKLVVEGEARQRAAGRAQRRGTQLALVCNAK